MSITTQLEWDIEAERITDAAMAKQDRKIIFVDLTALPDRKSLPSGRIEFVKSVATAAEVAEEAADTLEEQQLECVDCLKLFPPSERRGRSHRCPACLEALANAPKPEFHEKMCECGAAFRVPRTAGQHLRKWCDPCTEKRRAAVPEKAGTWTKTCECGAVFEASGKGAHFVKLCPTCKAKKRTTDEEQVLAPCAVCKTLFSRGLKEKQLHCVTHRS